MYYHHRIFFGVFCSFFFNMTPGKLYAADLSAIPEEALEIVTRHIVPDAASLGALSEASKRMRDVVRKVLAEVEKSQHATIYRGSPDRSWIRSLPSTVQELRITVQPKAHWCATDNPLVLLLESISDALNVKALYLSIGAFKSDFNCLLFVKALCKMPNKFIFRSLDLSQTYLEEYDLINLAPAIGSMQNLTCLDLSYNQFGSGGMRLVLPAVGRLTKLQHLNLTGNDSGMIGTANVLSNLTSLRALTFLHLCREMDLEEARALGNVLPNLTNLKVLTLDCNYFESVQEINGLAPGIGELTSLTALDLRRNAFRSSGMKLMAPSLGKLTKLVHLNLGANQIGMEGVRRLMSHISTLTNLESLVLAGNIDSKEDVISTLELFSASTHHLQRLKNLNLGFVWVITGSEYGFKLRPLSMEDEELRQWKALLPNECVVVFDGHEYEDS
jgi:hypothetical protein